MQGYKCDYCEEFFSDEPAVSFVRKDRSIDLCPVCWDYLLSEVIMKMPICRDSSVPACETRIVLGKE